MDDSLPQDRARDRVSGQLPLYTPEEHEFPRLKEPHEMSPEEFRNHPDTVFHANYMKFPNPGEKNEWAYGFSGIHAGTEQAAAERAAVLGRYRGMNTASSIIADQEGYQTRGEPKIVMHALHLGPYDVKHLDNPISDGEANQVHAPLGPHIRAYENEHEDDGSTSVVMPPTPPGPMTHSQYVDAAIEAGKGRQMHPETKMAHEAGVLDTYVKTSSEEAAKAVFPGKARSNQPSLFPFSTIWGPHHAQQMIHSREEVAKLAGTDPNSRDLYSDVNASSPHEAIEHLGDNLFEAKVHSDIDWENPDNNNKALGKLMSMGVNTEYRGTQRVSDRGDLRRGRQFRDVPDGR